MLAAAPALCLRAGHMVKLVLPCWLPPFCTPGEQNPLPCLPAAVPLRGHGFGTVPVSCAEPGTSPVLLLSPG